MRRPLVVLVPLLLALAACGTAKSPAAQPPAPPGASAAPATAASPGGLGTSCEALGQVYSKHMASFAEALSKIVGGATDTPAARRAQAQLSLKAFATAVRDATKSSTDPAVRADGKRTADKLQAEAADPAFFRGIRSGKDVSTVLGPTLTEWLAPVKRHCT